MKKKIPKLEVRPVKKTFLNHPAFVTVSFMLIMGNTLVLSMDDYNNKPSTTRYLSIANKVFTIIFSVEMILKLQVLGIEDYVRDGFNLFDGVLVIISVFDMALEQLLESNTGAGVITAFRTLRLLRIFKMATKSESILTLLKAIMQTLKDISFFSLLLLLYIFICALLGMEYFAYQIRVDNLEE